MEMEHPEETGSLSKCPCAGRTLRECAQFLACALREIDLEEG